MAFRFSADDMQAGESHAMPGMWATDKILAKGINRTLVGFKIGKDATTGDENWRIRLAGPICGTTRHVTVGDRTAVLFRAGVGTHAPCDHLAFVDLDTGKKLGGPVLQGERPLRHAECDHDACHGRRGVGQGLAGV